MTIRIYALAGASVFLSLGFTAAPVHANPFAGPYVGADAGYEDSGRLDKGGLTYGVFAGYNLPVSDKLIVGLEGRFGDSDIRETLTRNAPGFTTVTRSAVGRHYGAAARIGYAVGEQTLVYARGGWENVGLTAISTRTPLPPTTNPTPVVNDFSFNDDTLVIGAGIEHRIANKVGLRLSYDYGEKFQRHQARVGIVVGF